MYFALRVRLCTSVVKNCIATLSVTVETRVRTSIEECDLGFPEVLGNSALTLGVFPISQLFNWHHH